MNMSAAKEISVVFMILSFARANAIDRLTIDTEHNVDGISHQTKYKSFDIFPTKLTWPQALVFCKERHADLATIRSKEENDLFIESLNNAGFNVTTSWIWIGGTALDSSRGYFWMADGSAMTYTNWLPERPNDTPNYCIAYANNLGGTWGWNNEQCDTLTCHFACEYF